MSNQLICVHTYLQQCKTTPQPPGLADFLRGTVALFNFSKQYNYKLLIDTRHPLFNFLEPSEYSIVLNDNNLEPVEFLPPMSYINIFNSLENMFKSGINFITMTNSFYKETNKSQLTQFGELTNDCKAFLQILLQPSNIVKENMNNLLYNVYGTDVYKVIHLRCGDQCIYHKLIIEETYNTFYDKITQYINQNEPANYILISDGNMIAYELTKAIPNLKYHYNQPIHLGDLKNYSDKAMLDTLTDFFILSKSTEIIALSNYPGGSGFSRIVSLIFDIKYTNL